MQYSINPFLPQYVQNTLDHLFINHYDDVFICLGGSERVNILNCHSSSCMCSCTEFDEITFKMHTLDLWLSTSCDSAQSGKSRIVKGSGHSTKLRDSSEIFETAHGRCQRAGESALACNEPT